MGEGWNAMETAGWEVGLEEFVCFLRVLVRMVLFAEEAVGLFDVAF